MILLDTNVVSEIMRPAPDARVAAWMIAQPVPLLFTTAITEAEIFKGIEIMAFGKKRRELHEVAQAYFQIDMSSRILPFDSAAAHRFAEIVASRRKIGREIQPLDAQIAAIAKEHSAALATRNIDDFTECGVELIDPWKWRPAR
jgi:hypothetical protein